MEEYKRWMQTTNIGSRTFKCSFCDAISGSDRGYSRRNDPDNKIYICSNCGNPTHLDGSKQYPGVKFGNSVLHINSKEIHDLYEEARSNMSINAFTSCVLACRKILMHIAVNEGAAQNLRFIEYVEYLSNKGFVPPNGKAWVDHIRIKGNEANHEIKIMEENDAKDLIIFIEMLLKFIYEFPNKIPLIKK